MDQDVSAVRGWVQKRDGHQLGESGPGWSTSLPRHEQVPVLVARALSVDREAQKIFRNVQHSNRYVANRQDCRIKKIAIMEHIRYSLAPCQTHSPNPHHL